MNSIRLYAATLVLVLVVVVGGSLWLLTRSASEPELTTGFLAQHWQRPLLAQGQPPAHYSALESSLAPAACGQCHAQQYSDWSNSLHSQTMTAGVQWQLRLLPQDQANKCMDCHAPLAEQKALVALQQQWPAAPQTALPDHVSADLSDHGVVCAACHVRGHNRFGAVRRDGSEPVGMAHNGFTPRPEFSDSRFCASCHQFPDDGPRTAGKLREDTYQEWLASDYPAQGIQCQSCHMPERRHQWQGIHSPEMVGRALSMDLQQQGLNVIATLRNSGAGHNFPTYMVPEVTAQLWWLDEGREQLLAEHVLGWKVSVDLQTELFDQRLAPGAAVSFTAPLPQVSGQVELRLQVAPREHYERSFAQSLAYASQLDSGTLALLQQASKEAIATRFQWPGPTLKISPLAP